MDPKDEQKVTEPQNESNEPTVESPAVKYLKCGLCHVVSQEGQWIENSTEVEEYELVCPSCLTVNCDPEQRDDILAELISNLEEDQPVPEIYSWKGIVATFTKKELDELDGIKKQISILKKQEEKLSPKIKGFLVNNEITEFPFEGHKMTISYQNRSTMDEDKLVKLIEKLCSSEVIAERGLLKKISNPEAVTQALSDGLLRISEISECTIPNIVPVFNLNPKPKKSKDAPGSFGGNF